MAENLYTGFGMKTKDNVAPPTLKKLLSKTNLTPATRECHRCALRDSDEACLGTPDDIVQLIDAGYGMVLRPVSIDVVTVHLRHSTAVRMIQLISDTEGCALYKDGACLANGGKLKPTEGRYHIHPQTRAQEALMYLLSLAVVMEWIAPDNHKAVEYCFSHVPAHETTP